MLAFKLLIRSTQPFFGLGEPLKLEVACVSVPEIASSDWQERWNNACSEVKLKIEEARLGGYWGGVGLIAWLQNKLHLCLLPAGDFYEDKNHLAYSLPRNDVCIEETIHARNGPPLAVPFPAPLRLSLFNTYVIPLHRETAVVQRHGSSLDDIV